MNQAKRATQGASEAAERDCATPHGAEPDCVIPNLSDSVNRMFCDEGLLPDGMVGVGLRRLVGAFQVAFGHAADDAAPRAEAMKLLSDGLDEMRSLG